jgi:hypothetical protein
MTAYLISLSCCPQPLECRTGLDNASLGAASHDELTAWVNRLNEFGIEHTGSRDEHALFPYSTVVFRDLTVFNSSSSGRYGQNLAPGARERLPIELGHRVGWVPRPVCLGNLNALQSACLGARGSRALR